MSITAYVGLPGHGKSYGVVENVIMPACKSYRTVFTNIPCNADVFLERFGIAPVQFDIDDIRDNENWFTEIFEAGAIIVIDECWRLWPAGMNASRLRESDKTFFAEHRHMVGDSGHSTEIVLVTQDLSQIASFMRNLIETTFRVTKLSKVGSAKLYRVDVYSGSVTGPAPPVSRREREIPGKFKRNIYQLYKSHTKSSVGAGDESRADGRFNVLGGWQFKIMGLALIACIAIVWLTAGQLLNFFNQPTEPEPEPEPTTAIQPQRSPVMPPPTRSYQVQLPRRDGNDLISAADRVYITYNNGHFPNIDYLFRIVVGDGYSDVTTRELILLGYDVDPVAQCLVRISRDGRFYIAACESSRRDKRDFFSDLTTQAGPSGAQGDSGV